MKFSPIFFVSFALVLVGAASSGLRNNQQNTEKELQEIENYLHYFQFQTIEVESSADDPEESDNAVRAEINELKRHWDLLRKKIAGFTPQDHLGVNTTYLSELVQKLNIAVTNLEVTKGGDSGEGVDEINRLTVELKKVIEQARSSFEQFRRGATAAGGKTFFEDRNTLLENFEADLESFDNELTKHSEALPEIVKDFLSGRQSSKDTMLIPAPSNISNEKRKKIRDDLRAIDVQVFELDSVVSADDSDFDSKEEHDNVIKAAIDELERRFNSFKKSSKDLNLGAEFSKVMQRMESTLTGLTVENVEKRVDEINRLTVELKRVIDQAGSQNGRSVEQARRDVTAAGGKPFNDHNTFFEKLEAKFESIANDLMKYKEAFLPKIKVFPNGPQSTKGNDVNSRPKK